MRNAKKMFAAAAMCAAVASMGCMALTCSAAEVPAADAYVYYRSVDEAIRFEGVGNEVNTLEATPVSVAADGTYTVELTADSLGEIAVLKLYVASAEDLGAAEVTVNTVKINGEEVTLAETPAAAKSENDIYLDIWDTNGKQLFDRTAYQDATSISIDFTVVNWPVAETTTEETTTAPETTTTTAATTTAAATTAATVSNAATGDHGMVIGGVLAAAAACALLAMKKR
ncbi:MAG: hypothetical protein IJN11_02880 [Oscillospiraceae bacterium]|nr:hypothetical protein [Oscillospiraceae bacterium]